jgi:GNAT superfamily N-acetyltransferase
MKSVLRNLRRLPESMRWRNPGLLLLLIIREMFRPFIYWYLFDVFERDLRRSMPQPYSKEKLDVRIYEGTNDLQKVIEELASLDDLCAADIEARLGRGDVVAVAYAARKAVGCMWLTFASGMELAFGTTWMMGPAEALRYGAFVRPEWRGRAIHSLVNDAINQYARERGIVRTLAGISVLNSQSRNLPKHLRNSRAMRVFLLHVKGVNWTYRRAIGAPLASRFSIVVATAGNGLQFNHGRCLRVSSLLARLLSLQMHLRRPSRTRF